MEDGFSVNIGYFLSKNVLKSVTHIHLHWNHVL